jgi:CheY-like chemotaxis protein
MDVHMPVLSGIDATREIRRLESEMMLPPAGIFAITGAELDKTHNQAEYAAIGFTDILPKPISRKNFQAIVEQVLQQPQ